MPHRPSLARFLRYHLLRYQVLGFPVSFYLLATAVILLADWLSGGRLHH